jgi:DNA-directed RNA polymerase specialized sigma24 family protein
VSAVDTDFSDYAAARWKLLYRTAYVLCAQSQPAQSLIESTLGEAYARWAELRAEDPDAHVRRALLGRHASWRIRRTWASEGAGGRTAGNAHEDPTANSSLPAAEPTAVLAALLALPPGQRAVVILRCAHDVSPSELAAVLGWSTGTVLQQAHAATSRLVDLLTAPPQAPGQAPPSAAPAPRQELCAAVDAAIAEVPVPPLRIEQLIGVARSRRVRRRLAAVGTAGAAALALVAGVVLTGGDADPDPGPDPRAAAWEELGVPWIDDGQITYGSGTVPRPDDLTSLAVSADSAVMTVGDRRGAIVELRPDGSLRFIGEDAIGIALADITGHVAAWTQVVDARTSRLIAYDTAAQRVLATTTVARGVQVYALDGLRLVLHDERRGYLWTARPGHELVPFSPGTATQRVTDMTATHIFVTDFGVGSQLLDRHGDVVRTFPGARFSAGTFDPTGRFVSGLRPDDGSAGMTIYDIERDELIGLEVTGTVDWTRWTPHGLLVVRAAARDFGVAFVDTPVQYLVCEPANGRCRPLSPGDTTLAEGEGVDVGYLGQVALTSAFR